MSTNTRTKHTAGPWYVENLMAGGPRIVHGEPDADGYRDDVVFRQPTLEAQANARLIASAPELLAAARELCNFLDTYPHQFGVDISSYLQDLETAIGKAEGGL